jgi:hypothetical protein
MDDPFQFQINQWVRYLAAQDEGQVIDRYEDLTDGTRWYIVHFTDAAGQSYEAEHKEDELEAVE